MATFEEALRQFPNPPSFTIDTDEPDIEGGVRHLSISSDGTVDSLLSEDENPTPPESPRGFGESFPLWNTTREVSCKSTEDDGASIENFHSEEVRPVFFLPPPSPSVLRSGMLTPTPPSKLAMRRAESGQLPNKALLSLQRMTFETPDAGTGLGVGPNSAGWVGMEGISPGQQAEAIVQSTISAYQTAKDFNSATNAFGLVVPNSPTVFRQEHRTPMAVSPGSTFPHNPYGPRRSPLLRAQLQLGKLEMPHSPKLGSARPNSYHAPPSPLMRTSAFSYTNTGPLTPLTPSHVPGAPSLQSSSAFEWFDYSMPESPAWQTPELARDDGSEHGDVNQSCTPPRAPTTDHYASLRRSGSFSRLPPSPLGVGRFTSGTGNPFFAH